MFFATLMSNVAFIFIDIMSTHVKFDRHLEYFMWICYLILMHKH